MPTTFQGGLQATAATQAFGRPRATIDPDDYSSGFGVWSGTSFAAPLLAGQLAAALMEADCASADPVERARTLVAETTGVVPE
jgi:hypothetical protein